MIATGGLPAREGADGVGQRKCPLDLCNISRSRSELLNVREVARFGVRGGNSQGARYQNFADSPVAWHGT